MSVPKKNLYNFITAIFVALVITSSGVLTTNAYAQIPSTGITSPIQSQSPSPSPTPIPSGTVPTTGPSLPAPTSTPPQTVAIPSSTNYTIGKTSSGLVASDSFTNETASQQQLQSSNGNGYWFYGGDAPAENAPYTVWRDTQGLHIGAQAPTNGTYAGYYAVTPQTTATLYHVKVTAPVETIPSNVSLFENGMYVQNGTMDVNYVVCSSATSNIGTQWVVVGANGDVNGANTYTPFWWTAMTPTQPLSVDCTIITNGTNYLKVLLNNVPVYESKSLKLNMSSNFITFMEPQSSYAGQMLNGTFQNFYATSGGNVTVTNNPPGAANVKIVQSISSGNGNVLVSAPVDATGTAVLYAENQPMPINAYIITYDAKGDAMAETNGPVNIYGGDSYSVSGSATSYTISSTNPLPPPSNLVATTVSQSQINLTWSAPPTATALVTGYKIERMDGNSATWSTVVANTNSISTAYNNTGLAPNTTYTYRVSAVYGAAASSPTNTASATTLALQYQLTVASNLDTGRALNGLFTVLYNSTGQGIATGFTPASFVLNTGAQYAVAVANYATFVFDHWMDNGSTSNPRQVSITSDTTLTAVFKDTAVQLLPANGPAGTLVTVTGTTFASGTNIMLTFDGTALATTPAIVTTNSTGGFSATFQVPLTASSGTHIVTASDGTNVHSALFTVD